MDTTHFILGTAGHIDHGKSSLVKALTGTDPDRLPEEQARGMTIDLGFAHLALPGPGGGFSLGIVDVPGHADFVKNMVAGVGAIDVALLAVAADDSWMPQTEEHVQILCHLGVQRAVVALTKADLSDDLTLAEMDVREHLAGTPFAAAPIVPTSVVTGAGLDDLRAALAEMLGTAPPPADLGKPRLAVDRVFSVKGIGTVVTGTLGGGRFTKGQPAVVQPRGLETRLRNLQSHSHDVGEALPGTRAALNLQNVAVATREQKLGVARGDVVTLTGLGAPASALGVRVDKLAREIAGQKAAARPLRHGMRVRFHHGSGAHGARLFFVAPDRRHLAGGESALAHLRFDEPVFCFAGDRFVLRDWGMQATIGGGVVLDPQASRRHYRAAANLDVLERRAAAPDDPAVFAASQLARDRACRRAGLLAQSQFAVAAVDAAVAGLLAAGTAAVAGEWLVDGAWWRGLAGQAAALVDAQHRALPESPGLPLTTLATKLGREVADKGLFDALVAHLAANGFRTAGTVILRASHQPNLPPALEAAAEAIRRALAAEPLNPPGTKELLTSPAADKAFRFLLGSGEVVKLDDKVAVNGATYAQLVDAVRAHLAAHGPATASDLRQATGTTRRILVPLLERLDADKVTVRRGDLRSLAG